MAKFVKIGPVYVNLDMVASIDTCDMEIYFNTGNGLESCSVGSYFEDEDEFEKEVDLKLLTTRNFD